MSALDQLQVEVFLAGLLRQVRPRLRAIFAHYKIPPQDTEDILQQALLALLYRSDPVRDPEAWLVGTLRNKCMLYWREKRRKLYESVDTVVLENIAEPLAPDQETADLRQDLKSALETLPPRCRTLLSLRFRLGYEPPEVAERLGYRPSSISKITTRCLDALARYMVYPRARERKKKHG